MEEDEDIIEEEETGEQVKNSKVPPQLKPWLYKKGQSGNPSGRPLGISLKEYARLMFRTMTDEEREEFFHGIPKIDLFKMAEGNPDNKTDLTTNGEAIKLSPEVVALKEKFEKEINKLDDGTTKPRQN